VFACCDRAISTRRCPAADYLYESTGFFRQQQVIANLNARVNRRLNLFGYYTWNRANSDTDGAGSFPANQ
jgi:carboxylesterase type B